MKRTSRSHHSTLNELNITPLLDLVFVLLVIFIISTPTLVNHLEMNLPSSTPLPRDAAAKPPEAQRISVDASGQITLNNSPISITALRDRLSGLLSSNPELAVVVKGADEAEYQHVVSVLDVIQQLNIERVGLATE